MNTYSSEKMLEAIRNEGLDGWLFYNFHHRDSLADDILGLEVGTTNSRPWLYVVTKDREPVKIVHSIEEHILDTLPGEIFVYSGKEAFQRAVKQFSGKILAAHMDENLPVISFMDAGTAQNLIKQGIRLVSAASLIQRLKGLLSEEDMDSHNRAAIGLYEIVEIVWNRTSEHFYNSQPLYEGDLQALILEEMNNRNLITDHPPIVASGAHAGDPHYETVGKGSMIRQGELIQFDLWAKESGKRAIYADISWVGFYGRAIPHHVDTLFHDLVDSRELAIEFITAELKQNQRPSGASIDREVRNFLISKGYGPALKHRTGHGIDTECHGSGVNIDSIEFPDERLILDGSCFSIEPGIYFDEFGFRTEIDIYIRQNQVCISGKERQFSLLVP